MSHFLLVHVAVQKIHSNWECCRNLMFHGNRLLRNNIIGNGCSGKPRWLNGSFIVYISKETTLWLWDYLGLLHSISSMGWLGIFRYKIRAWSLQLFYQFIMFTGCTAISIIWWRLCGYNVHVMGKIFELVPYTVRVRIIQKEGILYHIVWKH